MIFKINHCSDDPYCTRWHALIQNQRDCADFCAHPTDRWAHLRTASHMLRSRLSCFVSAGTLKTGRLFSVARLPWAQEVPSSNLGAPTTYFFVFNELSLTLQRWRPNLGPNTSLSTLSTARRCSSGIACTSRTVVKNRSSTLVAGQRGQHCVSTVQTERYRGPHPDKSLDILSIRTRRRGTWRDH